MPGERLDKLHAVSLYLFGQSMEPLNQLKSALKARMPKGAAGRNDRTLNSFFSTTPTSSFHLTTVQSYERQICALAGDQGLYLPEDFLGWSIAKLRPLLAKRQRVRKRPTPMLILRSLAIENFNQEADSEELVGTYNMFRLHTRHPVAESGLLTITAANNHLKCTLEFEQQSYAGCVIENNTKVTLVMAPERMRQRGLNMLLISFPNNEEQQFLAGTWFDTTPADPGAGRFFMRRLDDKDLPGFQLIRDFSEREHPQEYGKLLEVLTPARPAINARDFYLYCPIGYVLESHPLDGWYKALLNAQQPISKEA